MLQHGGPNLGDLRYLTILELRFFQISAPRAELCEGGAIQTDMSKLQDLEVILGEAVSINNESHVLQRRVLKVMLPRELDFLSAVPDGVSDSELLAPAEAERVQRR
jgi:hypothetical protein